MPEMKAVNCWSPPARPYPLRFSVCCAAITRVPGPPCTPNPAPNAVTKLPLIFGKASFKHRSSLIASFSHRACPMPTLRFAPVSTRREIKRANFSMRFLRPRSTPPAERRPSGQVRNTGTTRSRSEIVLTQDGTRPPRTAYRRSLTRAKVCVSGIIASSAANVASTSRPFSAHSAA